MQNLTFTGALKGLVFLAVTGGCTGTQSGTESGRQSLDCEATERTSQPADLDIAQDLALQLGGQHSTALRWFRHDENLGAMNTQLNVDLSLDPESAIYVERTGAGGACTPTLELQATMVFETEDQTFTEELSGTLQHTSYGSQFTASLPLDQVRGSYNFSAIENIERYSALSLRTTISPLQGELFLSPDSNNSSPSNVVLTSPSIAEWGTTLPED